MGIEVNAYAAELARLTVWITELQWELGKGLGLTRRPILDKLDGILRADALITQSGKDRVARRGRGDWQPAVSRRKTPAQITRRHLRRPSLRGFRRSRSSRSRPRCLLVRKGSEPASREISQARRLCCNASDSAWSQPED